MTMKRAIAAACLVLLVSACSEMDKEAAPVELIATADQAVSVVDILNPPGTVGTINLQAIVKRADVSDIRFLDVQLRRYQVSYRRTDGGTLVPQSFVRSTSGIVPVGGSATPLNNFILLESDQVRQAPFVALLPQNGGRDPETGATTVKMDVIVDVFGETLAGDAVSARVIQPFTFCAGCT